jgi:O-antigen ligase
MVRWARCHHPWGDRIHFTLAILYAWTLPFAPAPEGPLLIATVITSLLRLPQTYRLVPFLVRDVSLWLLFAWIGWTALSMMWTVNTPQGVEELRAFRAILIPIAIFPLLDRLPWLIVAAIIGALMQNVMQITSYFDLFGDTAPNGRTGGLHHTIMAAAWFAVIFSWALGAVLSTRGRRRLLAGLVSGCMLLGLLATGSRGAWLSVIIGLPIGFGVRWLARRFIGRNDADAFALSWRPAAIVACTLIVAGAAAWPILQPRIDAAVDEYHAARNDGVYWTSVGLRVGIWNWGTEAWTLKPVRGHGAGSFRDALFEVPAFRSLNEDNAHRSSRISYLTRRHAHSTPLHTLITTGLVGFVLVFAFFVVLILRAIRDPADHVFADGQLAALLTWIVGSQFDSYHLTGHVFGLLMLLTAMLLTCRPFVRSSTR